MPPSGFDIPKPVAVLIGEDKLTGGRFFNIFQPLCQPLIHGNLSYLVILGILQDDIAFPKIHRLPSKPEDSPFSHAGI